MGKLWMEDFENINLHEDMIRDVDDVFDKLYELFHNSMLIILGVIMLIIVLNLLKNRLRDACAEVVRLKARVVSKRTNEADLEEKEKHLFQMTYSDYSMYYVTFLMQGGGRKEFKVSGREYGMLAEDDIGTLVYQGGRYVGFERDLE